MEENIENRGRKKGDPKVGGRKKGTPNKTTAEKRALTDRLVIYGLERMFNEKDQMDRHEVMSMTHNFMPYFQGKMENISNQVDDNGENENGEIEQVTYIIR